MEKIYIDEHIKVIEGEEASKFIEEQDQMRFYEEHVGIKQVPKWRWHTAQEYERRTWCEVAVNAIEDRNQEHLERFDSYKILKSVLNHDINVIELGCGPYTNLGIMLPYIKKRLATIDLLDPLVKDYILYSPNCTYKNGLMGFQNVNTISSTIEDFIPTKKYDLVIMINVLEHCFDVDLIFKKVFEMLNVGGILVLGDKVVKNDKVKEYIESIYDAGHPIRISEEYFSQKISDYNVLYSNEIVAEYETINKYLILQK